MKVSFCFKVNYDSCGMEVVRIERQMEASMSVGEAFHKAYAAAHGIDVRDQPCDAFVKQPCLFQKTNSMLDCSMEVLDILSRGRTDY
jgi:hypothetical protein